MKETLGKVIKRSIFIIDKGFQFKYSIILSLIVIVVSVLLMLNFNYFMNEIVELFIPNYKPGTIEIVSLKKKEIFFYLIFISLVLSVFTFFLGIVLTHKIAGPIMVIKRKIKSVIEGNKDVEISLRKGDEFKGLGDLINKLFKRIDN